MLPDRRQLLMGAAAAGLSAAAPKIALAADARPAATAAFDAIAEQILAMSPELATYLGLDVGARAGLKSRLSDPSAASVTAKGQFCVDQIARLSAIPDAGLTAADKLTKDVVVYALELGRDARAFDFGDNTFTSAMAEAATPYVVSQQGGTYSGLGEFLDSQHTVATAADAEAYLARLLAGAGNINAETDELRRDAGKGVVAPDFILSNTIGQISGLLETPADRSRFTTSLADRAKAKGLAGDWRGRATKIVEAEVYPALRRQLETLKALQAKSGHDAGVWRFKDGEAYYRWLLKVGTNTGLTAEEIHQTGLEQNRAIEARMDAILKANGLTQGTVGDRMTALASDPRFAYPDTDEGRAQVLAYLQQLMDGVRPKLAGQFNLKLKAPVVAKRVPVEIQDGAGLGYMNTGSLDGTRPSTYYINLKSTANWPKFSLPSLTYHETIPGHAWQGAYLTESGQLPLIRILLSGFNAYVEGWALYAEQLADEMGMYETDWAGQLGYLQAQRFRAVRLVVDTGLHAKRWSREQAIDWAVANSGRTRAAMTSEIDRYCATPGQACGYKVGHNEINRLRDRAKAALGDRFDVRVFNDTVVRTGAVPVDVLSRQIDAMIAGG